MNEKLFEKLISMSTEAASKLLFTLLILIIGFRVVKLISGLMRKSKGLEKLDPGVKTFLVSFSNILLKIIVIISAAGVLGIPMTSFITILGSAGVAIGLALQGSLSNIAGGLIILIFKPFTIGDVISFSDVSGTVESIGIFYTKIITVDNKRIVVPNGSITNQSLTNFSSFPNRRVDFTFCTGYDSDVAKVKEILISVAESHPDVLKEPAPLARLVNHGDSSLEFAFRVWCKTEAYWDVYFDIEEAVKAEFDKNSIEIPYPQMDVHVKNK